MNNYTKKLHHTLPFSTESTGIVIEVNADKGIMLNQSISYSENGGQEGDTGTIINSSGLVVPYSDTQNQGGRQIFLPDFPVISAEQKVYHVLTNTEDYAKFNPGDKVTVAINTQRRYNLMRSHSAIHLALMGVEKLRDGLYNKIKGCSIREATSRLDFATADKFTTEEIEAVEQYVNTLITADKTMIISKHPAESEAWFWTLDDYTIACGGTHLASTGGIGYVRIKKKNVGKNLARIICEIEEKVVHEDFFDTN